MNSVPHNAKNGKPHTNGTNNTAESTGHTPQDQIRGFHYSALHAVTGYNYLTRKWLAILGVQAYALIQVLRTFCYFNPETGEVRESCFPELATIAAMMGISRSTLCRLLKRDAEGYFIRYNRKAKTWERWELNLFLRIEHRRRYSAQHEREVQTSNLYLVALDDPPTPEDEAKVREKEQELLALLAERQAEEQKRQARVHAAETRAASFSASQFETLSADSTCNPQSRPKMTQQKSSPSNTTFNSDILRSGLRGERAGETIRNNNAASQVEMQEETEGEGIQTTQTTKSHRIEHRKDKETGPATVPLSGRWAEKKPAAPPSEREITIQVAEEVVGGVVYSLLADLGDTNPGVGTRIVLAALVDAGAPMEKMRDLAYLGRARMKRYQMRGGPVSNKPGYYINILRNLADEARREFWNVAKLEEKDQRSHERAIQASEARRQQQMGHRSH